MIWIQSIWNCGKNYKLEFNVPDSSREKDRYRKEMFYYASFKQFIRNIFLFKCSSFIEIGKKQLLDSGFQIKKAFVDKTCLKELLILNEGDLKISHNQSKAHLDEKTKH